MPERKLVLITGRSTHQGIGISSGKDLEEYQNATTIIQLNPSDMERFRLHEDEIVKLKTPYGTTTAKCQSSDLPEGLAFMAFGPATGQLIGGETHASGMPDSKGFEIEVEPVTG
jgi:formylmethanofuran dehydrogenase subunit D